MTGREKGVAMAPCGACGADLPVTTSTEGGLTTEPCSKCKPKAAKSETASQTTSRERGTTTEETS